MRGIPIRRHSGGLGGGSHVDSDLPDECEAFLAGQWAEFRRANGLPVPTWASLNQAAHASADIIAVAAIRPANRTPSSSTDVETLVARALLAASTRDELPRLQLRTLIPLELELLGTPLSPRRLVELAITALFHCTANDTT